MEFNIGDRVRVVDYTEIPETAKAKKADGNPHLWTTGKARCCGLVGNIVDKLYSEAYDCFMYQVQFDGQELPSRANFDGDAFHIVTAHEVSYDYRFMVKDGVVIATLYEICGDVAKEVIRGHGHLIHGDPLIAFAQAASYALKKNYVNLNGGEM